MDRNSENSKKRTTKTILTSHCRQCGSIVPVSTYREFTVCPYCKTRDAFPGFTYREIDWSDSMYAGVKLWMDCPACRSHNMYLGPEGKKWRCPDCGYSISDREKNRCVFWFCDECDTFLNVQEGFTEETGRWTCTECGFENDVTEGNVY